MPASVSTPSTSIATIRTSRKRSRKASPRLLGACVLRRGTACPPLVGLHHLFELPHDRLLVPALRQLLHLPKMAVQLAWASRCLTHCPLDLVVRGWLDMLVTVEELLIHLLARSEAGVDDLDVLIRDTSRPEDHVAGHVRAPDLFAHVQDEHITTLAHHAGLQDQLDGLRNGHEEPFDLGMGHGHGPSPTDLLGEDRHHAAVT